MSTAAATSRTPARPPQKIAVMIGQIEPGGSERQLQLFFAYRDRSRWEPVLYVSGVLGGWESSIRELGVPVVLLQGSKIAKMRQFRAAYIAQGATCFFSWSSYTNAFGLALVGLGMHRIGSFRNAAFADLPSKLRSIWSWLSVSAVTDVVCNSRETQIEIARRHGAGRRVIYAPNAVQIFSPEQLGMWRRKWRAELGLSEDEVLVLGAGRLAPQKNFRRFVEVIAEVRKTTPVHGVIVGPDLGCATELEAQIEKLGLNGIVRLIGSVGDARELMSAADMFLLSSDHEGMPNVVLEAMAAGTPCVATNVHGVADLIQHNLSGFVASFSIDDLAQHLVDLALDANLRRAIGAKARAAVERFQPEQTIPILWQLCEQPESMQAS
jgi:glycosyltransferase involved in cell wall biosynthesis